MNQIMGEFRHHVTSTSPPLFRTLIAAWLYRAIDWSATVHNLPTAATPLLAALKTG